MKRITAAFAILVASALTIIGCGKKEPNVAPEPDTETKSAVDVSWMLYCITDIEQICANLGEANLYGHPYYALPTPGNGTVVPTRDSSAKQLALSFGKAVCSDGRLRDGSILMNFSYRPAIFPKQTPNSRYYREYGFAGEISASEYKIDGWLIKLTNGGVPFYSYNTIAETDYDPAVTKITHYFGGSFTFVDPNDTSKTMSCEVRMNKTILNSTDKKVFNATKTNKNSAITWSLAVIGYEGEGNGTTYEGEKFTFKITPDNQLIRDMTCFPDKIATVVPTTTPGVVASVPNHHHPFTKGIMTLNVGKKYPRQIYYGNEGDLSLEGQCDNTGTVLIQGNSYRVDFRK